MLRTRLSEHRGADHEISHGRGHSRFAVNIRIRATSAWDRCFASIHAEYHKRPSANRFTTNQAQGQWLVGNLWDKSVYNAAGKSIGELKDVLIDKDGKVSALVVGVGGFLGLGEKNVAVDYDYLQKNGGITPNRITLGMSEEDLRNAPEFERSSSSSSH